MIDWKAVDSVFLDMDGTLLDLHFDNHFWLEHVPLRFAELHGLTLEQARGDLLRRYRSREGTLEWYCVEHWSRELGLDIALLKEELDHLIAAHPHVTDFLEALAERGKRRVLVTNAHQKSIALKIRSPDLRESVLIPSMAQYQALSHCVPCVTPMKCVLWGHGKNGVTHVTH
jgi:FMN phosphatase YigB (HAD superfamily)